MNKHERDFTTSASEHLNKRPTSQEIQTDIYDTDLHESCILDNQSQDKLTYGACNTNIKTHWCELVRQEHEKGYTLWASCDPYHEICDGGGISDKKLKHYWKSTNDDDHIDLEWERIQKLGAIGIKSLQEDGDNLKDFRQISNLEAMLREFSCPNSTLSSLFHFLNVQ
ncbi:hypothetical protein Tco_0370960 [Tanacetum coccineum]